MLEQYFVRPTTIDRIRASWLAPQIEQYVEWMEAQGYHLRNFFRRVPILCHFADFAQQRGCMDFVSASSPDRDMYLTPLTRACSVWGHGRGFSEDIA